MKDLWLRNKRSKFSLEYRILLVVLVLMVIVALCIAEHTASDNSDNTDNNAIFSQEGFIDPFTLRTIVPVMGSSSGTVILGGLTTRSTTWIPFRPPVRKPVSASLGPGQTVLAPGPPS